MRTGVAGKASRVEGARRRGGSVRPALACLSSLLLCLLLVLQAGVPTQHARHVAGPASAKATALASLGAAIGQSVSLCEHDGDPAHPGDPADLARCEHCVFCHSMAGAFTPNLSGSVGIARLATATTISRPPEDVALVRDRYAGSATPRGPPALG